MTRKLKKVLALLLTLSMVMSMVSVSAFADEGLEENTTPTVAQENQAQEAPAAPAENEDDAGEDEEDSATQVEEEGNGEAGGDSGVMPLADEAEKKCVAQIGENRYETLQDAIDAATDGQTVTLLANAEIKTVRDDGTQNFIEISGKAITLDLNGHTASGGYLWVDAGLTVVDNSENKAGTIDGTDYGILLTAGSVAVESGTIMGRGTAAIAVKAGELNITGGTIQCTGECTDDNGAAIQIETTFVDINITISGGRIISDNGSAIYQYGDAPDKLGRVEITGGTFTGGEGKAAVVTETPATHLKTQFFIKGGTFSSNVSDYCAADCKWDEETGNVMRTPPVTDDTVATVGSMAYQTLQAAIDAATEGQTVTLRKNTNENVTIAAGQDITLDLNGKTLNGGTAAGKPALTNNGTVTVVDSSEEKTGTIKREDTPESESAYYTVVNKGHTIIRSGHIGSGSRAIQNWDTLMIAQDEGKTTIIDGNVQTLSFNSKQASTTITGGTINGNMVVVAYNSDPEISISGGTFSTPVDPQYCAAGFLPVKNGDTYGVTDAQLTLTADPASRTGAGAVTLTVDPANLTAEVEVTCGSEAVTLTKNANGTYTADLPNATAEYTFTVRLGTKTATCAVSVSYEAPYVPPTPTTPPTSTTPDTPDTPPTPTTPTTPTTPATPDTPDTPVEELDENDTPLVERPWTFVDVKEKDWFYGDVKTMFDRGVIGGMSETAYEPYTNATRAMVATLLYRMAGSPSVADLDVTVTDVAAKSWYHDAAVWAYATGVFNGYKDGSFRGNRSISREELAAVLSRYAAAQGLDVTADTDLSGFTDASGVSKWAVSTMKWAVSVGLINGRGGRLAARDSANRAELATMLVRFEKLLNADAGEAE